jgi:hypothetical protein
MFTGGKYIIQLAPPQIKIALPFFKKIPICTTLEN